MQKKLLVTISIEDYNKKPKTKKKNNGYSFIAPRSLELNQGQNI